MNNQAEAVLDALAYDAEAARLEDEERLYWQESYEREDEQREYERQQDERRYQEENVSHDGRSRQW